MEAPFPGEGDPHSSPVGLEFATAAVEALEMTEESRVKHTNLSAISRALIRAVKVGLQLAGKPQPNSGTARAEIAETIECTLRALRSLRDGHANFFGAFKSELCIQDIQSLADRLQVLLNQLTAPQEEKEYMMEVSAEQIITGILPKIFWLRHFRDAVEVPWKKFADAFIAEYDFAQECQEVHERLIVQLQPHLEHPTTGGVTAQAFEDLTRRFSEASGGLYSCFQALCDPVRVVYAMGTVEDDANATLATPSIVYGLLGLNIHQICCGGQHAAILTSAGEIYTWGRGGFGRLGHGDTVTLSTPKRVAALEGTLCCQVACGFAYSAAVTDKGVLYTWGAGENGRLGHGDVDDRHVPSQVEELVHTPIRQVFAGSVHTCVLTRAGHVFSFGKHEYTGHGCHEDVLLPRLLDDFEGRSVTQISVGPGGYHTIALTTDKEVYTWGHNRVGQLGYSNSQVVPRNVEGAHFLPTPKMVASLSGLNVRQVVAGWGHSAVLTLSGQVFICGRNFQGQLGLGDPSTFPQNERGHPYQSNFKPVQNLEFEKVVQIACGGEHSVALTEEGTVFTFGAGNKGQLGHGGSNPEHFPRLLVDLKKTRRDVHQVTCGNNCTLILAGHFNPSTLLHRCMETIRNDSDLMTHLDAIPSDLALRIHQLPEGLAVGSVPAPEIPGPASHTPGPARAPAVSTSQIGAEGPNPCF